jgi:hypothetical protein
MAFSSRSSINVALAGARQFIQVAGGRLGNGFGVKRGQHQLLVGLHQVSRPDVAGLALQ